jgi:hypothetical protein
MNDDRELKKRILRITIDLLLNKMPMPNDGSISNIKGLGQCVAFVLDKHDGLAPAHAGGCHLKNDETETFYEVVWDLICARVITPKNELNGLNEVRLHSDAISNWERYSRTIALLGN